MKVEISPGDERVIYSIDPYPNEPDPKVSKVWHASNQFVLVDREFLVECMKFRQTIPFRSLKRRGEGAA